MISPIDKVKVTVLILLHLSAVFYNADRNILLKHLENLLAISRPALCLHPHTLSFCCNHSTCAPTVLNCGVLKVLSWTRFYICYIQLHLVHYLLIGWHQFLLALDVRIIFISTLRFATMFTQYANQSTLTYMRVDCITQSSSSLMTCTLQFCHFHNFLPIVSLTQWRLTGCIKSWSDLIQPVMIFVRWLDSWSHITWGLCSLDPSHMTMHSMIMLCWEVIEHDKDNR